jgi:hypothetical protein
VFLAIAVCSVGDDGHCEVRWSHVNGSRLVKCSGGGFWRVLGTLGQKCYRSKVLGKEVPGVPARCTSQVYQVHLVTYTVKTQTSNPSPTPNITNNITFNHTLCPSKQTLPTYQTETSILLFAVCCLLRGSSFTAQPASTTHAHKSHWPHLNPPRSCLILHMVPAIPEC